MVNLWLLNALLIHNPRTDPFPAGCMCGGLRVRNDPFS
jgi:hypothetical protein